LYSLPYKFDHFLRYLSFEKSRLCKADWSPTDLHASPISGSAFTPSLTNMAVLLRGEIHHYQGSPNPANTTLSAEPSRTSTPCHALRPWTILSERCGDSCLPKTKRYAYSIKHLPHAELPLTSCPHRLTGTQ